MFDNEKINSLILNLPDPESAARFFAQLQEKHLVSARKLLRKENQGLLSDALALVAWSPFLATTILQHPDYLVWLGRKRAQASVRTTEDLLEALARFSLMNSQLEPAILLARFRRRELLRIYLRDIRNLATIAELTLDLSNLADACLEYALRYARQELENRFGVPLETDDKGRLSAAQFCVVALGKLGSRELNYASDIDLLFLYSTDGTTSGTGTRGTITNREFFVKLAELVSKTIGQPTGQGAAYRVDLRLRPHGRVGALAVSIAEAVSYYKNTARDWERQVLLRARSSAGDSIIYKRFFQAIESIVFQPEMSVAHALESVRNSKHKIDQEHKNERGFNVKLGRGGIREIEFIAQALQLAYAGRDSWLRAPHTLISLRRLADRQHISESQLTVLSEAYAFLRTLEHRLQMEHGIQTHAVPDDPEKRLLVARRLNFSDSNEFEKVLQMHLENVSRAFENVFSNQSIANRKSNSFDNFGDNFSDKSGANISANSGAQKQSNYFVQNKNQNNFAESNFQKSSGGIDQTHLFKRVLAALEKNKIDLNSKKLQAVELFCEATPQFSETLAANPQLIEVLPESDADFTKRDYQTILLDALKDARDFRDELAVLRATWSRLYFEIAAFDAFERIEMRESNRLQTELAEASLNVALSIVQKELFRGFVSRNSKPDFELETLTFELGVLGLGRLGGRGMDYGSDLDLVLIYDENKKINHLSPNEFYSRASEILVTTLSSLTREGYLYRVDLRLRPDGRNGAPVNSKTAFLSYLQIRSAIWEWLAYVKLRAVNDLAWNEKTEFAARQIVHGKALQTTTSELKAETVRVRNLLEQQKAKNLRRGEIDIKYGPGGLLDVYFAVRFLQLRDNVLDDAQKEEKARTTSFTLQKLHGMGALDNESFEILSEGYEFLRALDHALRLLTGRSSRLPSIDSQLLMQVARRLKFDSAVDLLAQVAVQTANVRFVYAKLLSNSQ